MDNHDDNSDDELLESDCDYVFMQEYKEKRIQQMTQNEPSKRQATPSAPSSVSLLRAPEFGVCVNGGGEGWYVREVEEEDPRVTVVVHIYQPDIPYYLIMAQSHLSGVNVKASSLPIISTYRKGALLAVLKDFAEDLLQRSDNCSREDVEWLLESSNGWVIV